MGKILHCCLVYAHVHLEVTLYNHVTQKYACDDLRIKIATLVQLFCLFNQSLEIVIIIKHN